MDRQIVWPGALPLETDLLSTNKNAMVGLSMLTQAMLGTTTGLAGLACTPNSPAALNVLVGPGSIYSQQVVDATAYSSLAADTTDLIMKQGIALGVTTLACPAPVTVGYSINYLVEFAFQEVDGGSTLLPYYNSATPSSPFSGPGGLGTPNFTVRQDKCLIQIKAGTPATTGTQTTPAVDAGYVVGYVVTVAYGQTTVVAGNITVAPGAPFISEALTAKISQATADLRYAQLGGFTATGPIFLAADPTLPLGAATKQYVDAVAQGLQVRLSVACATTGNITLSGEQTIDGVLTSASRVLVKNQTTASQNGIYVSSSGGWSRSSDANTWATVDTAYTFVTGGTVNISTGWASISGTGGTIGTTAITFAQFSAAGTYTSSGGITKTGSNFALSTIGANTVLGSVAGGTPAALTQTQLTALINATVGDSGSGGTLGAVPAAPAGSAAKGLVLGAGGAFVAPPGLGGANGLKVSAPGGGQVATLTASAVMMADASNNVKVVTGVSLTPSLGTSGANGLDTGTVAINTWYSLWAINNGTTQAALFSLSATAPTMPGVYTFKQRLGWVLTDGSSNIVAFVQYGKRFQYINAGGGLPRMATGSTSSTWSGVAWAAFAPSTIASMQLLALRSGFGYVGVAPNANFAATPNATNTGPIWVGANAGTWQTVTGHIVPESANVYYNGSQTGDGMFILGFEDNF